MTPPLRLGVMGTGRVVAYGLIAPARQTPGVEVEAIASRSAERARAAAGAHAIQRAYGSYDALLTDPALDAVYIALPPALHGPWVHRALEAGKHVLCEKPLALNAAEAAALAACAARHGRVLLEAMHLRYMRRLERQREMALGGELGPVIRVDSCFRMPRVRMSPDDFRLSAELGGGAALDIGCYAVSCLRYVAGEEPQVAAVRRRLIAPGVDRWMRADVRFPSGAVGRIECGFRGVYLPRMAVTVTCKDGAVTWSRVGLAVRRRGRSVQEPMPPDWTYQRQLEAFARRVRGQASEVVTPEDSVGTAAVLDAMYALAGLGTRGRSGADVP